MWKLFFVIITSSLSVNYVYSQIDTTKLFYAKNFESDAFVELGSSIRQINNNAGMDIDFSVNWLVEHKYYLGFAYGQLANVEQFNSAEKSSRPPFPVNISTTIKYQTAGLRFGYIFFPDQKIISFSPDLTLGWAGIKLFTEEEEQKLNGAMISPALKGIFNVSDFFRIGVSINYTAFIFEELDTSMNQESEYITQFSSKSLNGLGGGVFLRIGQF
jgi:hypothetical protein